ncbi:MAG: restriction endonuclease-like protein [Bacteroidaceae bacterium]|nr:restriction endonuclease-like protein [Bacteroidaceae bacterium]
MDLLTIQHEDFTMFVDCTKFDDIWNKAKSNVGEKDLLSTYTWSEGVVSVERNGEPIARGAKAPAVFFDNAEYPVWVDFTKPVAKAQFGSMLQSDNERFTFRGHTLAGFINYGNDIGKSELNIVYQTGTESKRFTFGYEVLSTKLNYHEHWKKIIEDIEQEYRMLSFDYLRRTFHGFTPDEKGDTPELIWWNVFAKEQERFVKACKNIIERPRRRLRGYEVFLRADKLKRVPANIENELAEHRKEPAHQYRVEEHVQSNDTQENRFLKYALGQIREKYESLKKRIETLNGVGEMEKEKMQTMLDTLKHLQRNPFFRTVGRFKGLNQESLVLQRASGYSQVYRTWNLLRRAYSLKDGIYRLQSKDIATLYEIWCFIEVSHIVREQLGITVDGMEHRNRMEMNGMFTWELGKGEHSRILFRKDGVELAELVYNPRHTRKENDNISMENLVVPTVAQKPDIVLQLTKHDQQKDMKMTYLFDAKYRIEGRVNGVDTPPEDAINQMHRYRDAIYYKENKDAALKKEVIGGYILFPGDGQKAEVEVSKFYKTIDEVNIGAFPLRPKDKENRDLLVKFIETLIGKASTEILDDSIPQKGLYYTSEEPKDAVYMILTLDTEVNEDVNAVLEGKADIIIMGRKGMEETKDIQSVRYVAPIIPGGHIKGYYKVVKANLAHVDDEKYPIRIKFDVTGWQEIERPARFGMAKAAYRGYCRTRDEFFRLCREQMINDRL